MSHGEFVPGFTIERRRQAHGDAAGFQVERRRRPFVYVMSNGDAVGHMATQAAESSGSTQNFTTLTAPPAGPVIDDLFNLLTAFQEKERERVAADLHDSIGSALTAIKFRIEDTLQHLEGGASGATAGRLRHVTKELTRTIEEVRRIAMNLRPAMLDQLGIAATINWYCREIEDICPGLQVTKQIEVVEKNIPCHLKTTIFRIVQEAAANTIKHSGAETLHISLTHDGCTLHLSVKDDGRGFDMAQMPPSSSVHGGLGLIGMHQRMKSSGGILRIKSKPGIGTRVVGEWPLGGS